MQIPVLILALAIEVYFLLLIGTLVLLWYSRRQKGLIRRQQQKLLEVIAQSTSPAPIPAAKTYKHFINEQLTATQTRFNEVAAGTDITLEQPADANLDQKIAALRYAFLRAEELGTTEAIGSTPYWQIFQQTLMPLLFSDNQLGDTADSTELDAFKKRVENLEKFKKLYFELEAKWENAQHQAEDYLQQLHELADQTNLSDDLNSLLDRYHASYFELGDHFLTNSTNRESAEHKTINIIRQDPRAAEEIIKLRNVAADQYRIINNLQKKLEQAQSDQEKALIFQELEQQLQRQIRFVQESDTCIQLLEDELTQANERIATQEQKLEQGHRASQENQRIKETLQSFTLESKELVSSVHDLQSENSQLRANLAQLGSQSPTAAQGANENQLTKAQTTIVELQKQYADLEEKYLALKLK